MKRVGVLILGSTLLFSDTILDAVTDIFSTDTSTSSSKILTNHYACGIFQTGITTYGALTINGAPKICGSYYLSAAVHEGNAQCSVDYQTCSALTSCEYKAPSNQRYTAYFIESDKTQTFTPDGSGSYSLNSNNYGDINFNENGATLTFEASTSYDDNPDKKYMTIGNASFVGNNYVLKFEPGDYYFDSLNLGGTNGKIIIDGDGPVRIFVKGNINITDSNLQINADGDSQNLLIYSGGNLEITTAGEEDNSKINGYIYVKGGATINASNNLEIHGSLTAEASVNINAEKFNLYYDGQPEQLGYGRCDMCYDPPRNESGIAFDFGSCPGFSFSFFGDIYVPIEAYDNLNNVTVDELHKQVFGMNFLGDYSVVDENENFVRSAIKTNNAFMDMNLTGIVDTSLFNEETIPYPLGKDGGDVDNNSTNGLTYSFTNYPYSNYQQLHSSSLMSFNLCDWYGSLVYVAHYDKNGKHYDVILGQCEHSSNGKDNTYTSGPFDAWDVDKDINHRVITTKEVKKGFQLKIASLNADNNATEPKPYLTFGDIKFRLLDTDKNTSLTPWMTIRNPQNPLNIVDIPPISEAHKHVRANFKFCQKDSDDGIIIVPSIYCETNQDGYEYNTSVVSSDDFAIRPDKFVLEIDPDKVKAGNEFNATIKAVDVNGNPVKDYNETVYINANSPELEFVISKPNCIKGNLQKVEGGEFKDGVANIKLKYSEVGDVNFSVKEINGSEFAKVDEDDTPDSQRFITASNDDNVTFIPDHFDISANLSNFNGAKFTYLSNDLDMASPLNINITAKNSDDEVTQNYNKECYAKDVDITISEKLTPDVDLDKLYRYNGKDNEIDKDKVINFIHTKDNFTTDNNGSTEAIVYLNFKRNPKKPVNAFDMTINEINVSDATDDINSSITDIPGKATYRYGRIEIDKSTSSVSPNQVKALFNYNYWTDDRGWVLNKDHKDKTFGEVYLDKSYVNGKLLDDANSPIQYSADEVKDGKQNVTFKTNHPLPFGAKIHLAIPSWLWYHPLAKPYKAPSKDNTDCLTHPCTNIVFLSSSVGWGGVVGGSEAIQKEFNASKKAIDINVSNELNASKRDFFKVNW